MNYLYCDQIYLCARHATCAGLFTGSWRHQAPIPAFGIQGSKLSFARDSRGRFARHQNAFLAPAFAPHVTRERIHAHGREPSNIFVAWRNRVRLAERVEIPRAAAIIYIDTSRGSARRRRRNVFLLFFFIRLRTDSPFPANDIDPATPCATDGRFPARAYRMSIVGRAASVDVDASKRACFPRLSRYHVLRPCSWPTAPTISSIVTSFRDRRLLNLKITRMPTTSSRYTLGESCLVTRVCALR